MALEQPVSTTQQVVAHLTSAHPPFDSRIMLKECRTLAEAGYRVTLIAPHSCDEVVGGVQIIAIPKPKGRGERFGTTPWHVFRAAMKLDAQVYHLHDPELLPIGLLMTALGKRVVYDAHEDVPKDLMVRDWLSPSLRVPVSTFAGLIEAVAAWAFSGIVTATPAIASKFPPAKTVTVQNFPLPGELVAVDGRPYQDRPPNAVYIGGINVHRGIREMVAAIDLVPKEFAASLSIAGSFESQALYSEVQAHPGWKRVHDLGWVDRVGVRSALGDARVGLVVLHGVPNHLESQPIKLYEYMSAGLPVVVSDFPLWRRLVEDVGCGIVVDPMEPKAIADAMCWLFSNPDEAASMGQRGRQAILERYNWPVEGAKLLQFYANLLR